ncbi:MAG: Ppx/GppA phosphatase family protein [Bacteroidota bacterium]|nr:Ppx/GppA phosphatase family protein [Bacteroidota bacterium]MDP4232196.1 Ppx/GppA phosphatase family protein [Bacteroidota bacterium]MDP4243623.1 Ppx/GppA phosphatase family protein [Bacteroidota bacterium]MDP4288723.1 Ppx/GppA phosphatase family protein [Bacteroidota bacterium]
MGLLDLPISNFVAVRAAILDIGTNTVLLLIAERENGGIRVVTDRHAIARLGEGVDRARKISDAAYERLIGVLREHQRVIAEYTCDRVVAVATSAMRDADNSQEIIQRTKADTGIAVELLSGGEEARWTYRGAIDGMPLEGPIRVVDIGGGSTEISTGTDQIFERGTSFDIGAVRLTERCFATSPITMEAREAARKLVRHMLEHDVERASAEDAPKNLVAVAGTPTTLAAMHQELTVFDAAKVHGYVLRRQAVDQMLEIVFSVSTATLLERFPAVNKARADILPAGTLILAEVMEYLGAEQVTVSTQGLRYGIALRELFV